MKNNVSRKGLYLILTVSPLLLLSACSPIDWAKEKFGGKCADCPSHSENVVMDEVVGGEWVVKVGDKVVVSGNKFESEFNQLLEEKPQLKSMLPLMPNLEKDFAKGLGNQEVITKFVSEKGLDKTPEYLAKKERMKRAVLQMLNTEFFAEAFKSKSLSNADVKKFYEDNKDTIQGVLISRGGVDAIGISFDKKVEAEEFLTKAKAAGNTVDLEKLAKDAGKKVRNFNLVNNQNYAIDPVLRTKILALKTFPIVDMIMVKENSFWVVHAKEKTETQYRPFEQVKDGIRNVAEQTEKGKMLQEELEKLSKTYDVKINDTFFDKKTTKQGQAAIDAQQMFANMADQLPESKTA